MGLIMRGRKSKPVRTIEAVIDRRGRVLLLENVRLPKAHRALLTILEDTTRLNASEIALLSEPALAVDWNRPEKDEVWSHLQSEP